MVLGLLEKLERTRIRLLGPRQTTLLVQDHAELAVATGSAVTIAELKEELYRDS